MREWNGKEETFNDITVVDSAIEELVSTGIHVRKTWVLVIVILGEEARRAQCDNIDLVQVMIELAEILSGDLCYAVNVLRNGYKVFVDPHGTIFRLHGIPKGAGGTRVDKNVALVGHTKFEQV